MDEQVLADFPDHHIVTIKLISQSREPQAVGVCQAPGDPSKVKQAGAAGAGQSTGRLRLSKKGKIARSLFSLAHLPR